MSNSLSWLAVVGSTALVLLFSPAQATDLKVPVLAPRLADRDLLSVKYPKKCESKAFKTRGSLNSCEEQEKCFSISYDKVDVPCENDNCDFKWKVCININKDNPCCRVKDGYYPFETACVRGNKMDSCVDDSVSFDNVKKIKELEFGDEYCELVTPGNNATFVLVSSIEALSRYDRRVTDVSVYEVSWYANFSIISPCRMSGMYGPVFPLIARRNEMRRRRNWTGLNCGESQRRQPIPFHWHGHLLQHQAI